jgi:uncharacterized membrane protein
MRATARHLSRIFLTGLLTALPVAATVFIFVAGVRLLYDWVGPSSLVGGWLARAGLGHSSEVAGYLIGVGALLLCIFMLGLLVQTRLRVVLHRTMDGVMQRIPLVRHVYDIVRKMVDLLSQRDKDGLASMRPVWLRFGGPGQVAVLGLLSTPEPVLVCGEPYLGVMVPTSPVPVGGGLLYVPQAWVTLAPLGVDGLTSIYVSMGVTSAQHLGKAGDTEPRTHTVPAGEPETPTQRLS